MKVETVSGCPVRILCTNKKSAEYPIVALRCDDLRCESLLTYTIEGRCIRDRTSSTDLVLKVPIKQRRMTNQELAWWLRDCPEEHRECVYINHDGSKGLIQLELAYSEEETYDIADSYLIRSNGGEWRKPIIVEYRVARKAKWD